MRKAKREKVFGITLSETRLKGCMNDELQKLEGTFTHIKSQTKSELKELMALNGHKTFILTQWETYF